MRTDGGRGARDGVDAVDKVAIVTSRSPRPMMLDDPTPRKRSVTTGVLQEADDCFLVSTE